MGRQQGVGRDGRAPGGIDPDHLGPQPIRHLAHALAEDAVHADHDRIAGPDEVDEGGLHAGRTGAADGQGQRVRGGEDLAEALVGGVEQGQEFRVEVAEDRSSQGRATSGYGLEGPGPINRRSGIGTGASWQNLARLRQRALGQTGTLH